MPSVSRISSILEIFHCPQINERVPVIFQQSVNKVMLLLFCMSSADKAADVLYPSSDLKRLYSAQSSLREPQISRNISQHARFQDSSVVYIACVLHLPVTKTYYVITVFPTSYFSAPPPPEKCPQKSPCALALGMVRLIICSVTTFANDE